MEDKHLLNIQLIEIALDNANSEYGDKKALCIYCKSITYDGRIGLIHDIDCPVSRIRKVLFDEYKKRK